MTEAKPSKSARKREAHACKELADELLGLGDEEIACLDLDERLTDAVEAARRMKSREALRRQKQFIAKLLMNVDADPLRALIEQRDAAHRRHQQQFHQAERWRDRLVRDRSAAVEDFESAVGRDCGDVRKLVEALDKATSDREEKGIRKAIFRSVFDVLGQPSGASVAERADDR